MNINEIVTGVHPNLAIDYSKVTLSKGKLKTAEQPSVEMVPQGIRFDWHTFPQMPWEESTDQVMMLAYLPLQQRVYYTLFGNSRIIGNDILTIPDDQLNEPVYTYISFVAANRSQLANSSFVGALNLTP